MTEQISSKDKRILVFSDPHQEVEKVKKILTKENYDQVVCLGDWFDSFFYEDPIFSRDTAHLLRELVFKSNFLTLYGNHDLHYLYSNQYAICRGYHPEKDKAIKEALGSFMPAVRDKFQWFVWVDNYLCTHAGISTHHFPPNLNPSKEGITDWLRTQVAYVEPTLCNGGSHWFYRAGQGRGGSMRVGGIVWMDFDTEFEPIEGIKQLVGHSYHRTILNHVSDGNLDLTQANDLDIDCNLNQYLIIENGKLEIKKYVDL